VCLISGSSSADDLRDESSLWCLSAWDNFTAEAVEPASSNNYENVNCASLGFEAVRRRLGDELCGHDLGSCQQRFKTFSCDHGAFGFVPAIAGWRKTTPTTCVWRATQTRIRLTANVV
jgi:hypothetical protein